MTKIIFQLLNSYQMRVAMIAFTLLATSFTVHSEESKIKNSTITVTATGESKAAPDMAIINLAIVTSNKIAQKALAANNKSMTNVINALKKSGIQENDLQTSGLSIYQSSPDTHNAKQNNESLYYVSKSLTVRIRDLSNAGKIFDQAMALGVNSVNGITFTNTNTKPFYKEARERAIAEAIEKAETIAQAAHLKLGKIIKINESDDGYHPTPRLMSSAINTSSADTNFSSGELSYNVNVTVTFVIE
ncbi:SIMPL domain-containing protein [Bartonella sp. CB74]|uniref:SIMPL domain-containing protein n=1 Tax=Bartonella sp. CB74 TaxID=3113620 RepID=UPI002F96142F